MRIKSISGVTTRDAFNIPPALIGIKPEYNVTGRAFDIADDTDRALMESIRAKGVTDPLTVRTEGESIIVVAGHRRLGAVMALIASGHDVPTVPAISEGRKVSESDRVLDLMVSNSGKPLTPLQIGEVCLRLRQLGNDDKWIATNAGCSVRFVQGMIVLASAPAIIRDMVSTGIVSSTFAYETIQREGVEKATVTLCAARDDAEANGKTRITAKTVMASKAKRAPRIVQFVANDGEGDTVCAPNVTYEASKRSIFITVDGATRRFCTVDSVDDVPNVLAALRKGL